MINKINGFCKKIQLLSGAWLKLIAIISMLADHVNKALIYPYLYSNHGFLSVMLQYLRHLGHFWVLALHLHITVSAVSKIKCLTIGFIRFICLL